MVLGVAAPLPVGKRAEGLIVAGPTCSGKSALALWLAQRLGGAVINADSMQVYTELRVLTARPSPQEDQLAPHSLYGVRPAAMPANAAWWREAALRAMAQARAAGLLPILCGGTGLYFHALRRGLAQIPPPLEAARREARESLATLGPAVLHARLAEVDPVTAGRLQPHDGQRIARAWEVWRSTGRGLADWQSTDGTADAPPLPAILLDPDRAALRMAIAGRFAAMLDQGAVEEVGALLALDLDPALPAMRAHGVPELSAYLHGEIGLAEAGRRTELVTGQYTKRQATWFRHHTLADPSDTHTIHARFADWEKFSAQNRVALDNFIQERVDGSL
jgi:tRNA dimethylallyltransferase